MTKIEAVIVCTKNLLPAVTTQVEAVIVNTTALKVEAVIVGTKALVPAVTTQVSWHS